MKVLLTADWHLGKYLNDRSLIDDQRMILDRIVELIEREEVDVFVLAGDIFQHYNISDEALELFNGFLEDVVLCYRDVTFFITNGNHDSAEKLHYGSRLMRRNLKIITKFDSVKITPQPIEKENRVYNFYIVPFIRVHEFVQRFPEFSNRISHFEELYRTLIKSMDLNKQETNIFVGHLAVDFRKLPDTESNNDFDYDKEKTSEDDTYGNVELVDPGIFSDFDFVFLGHFHKQWKRGNIYYPGSIYMYSEKEAEQKKGVWLIDLKERKEQFLPLQFKRSVRVIRGSFNDIMNKKEYEQYKDDYVYIKLEDRDNAIIINPRDALSQKFQNIVDIHYENSESFAGSNKLNIKYDELIRLNDVQLFEKYLFFIYGIEDSKENNEENNKEYENARQELQKKIEEKSEGAFSYNELIEELNRLLDANNQSSWKTEKGGK